MVYGMMDVDGRLQISLDEEEKNIEIRKCCADCKTTKTPLWRGGPAGPKSLCNACGIRYRKKRRDMLGLHKESKKKNRGTHMTTICSLANGTATSSTVSTSATFSDCGGGVNELRESLKMRLIVMGGKMMFQRSTIVKKQRCQRRRKLGEEEQAALSLLALSCGSVFA